jgi:hypothetical protein
MSCNDFFDFLALLLECLHLSSRPTSHFLQVESSFTALVAVAWTS